MTTIPAWTANGVLPPVSPEKPTGPERSPYPVSLVEVVRRFGTSPERCAILDGLLRLRSELQRMGLDDGFQWLDGSFLENVEQSAEKRAPRDVDVVTFLNTPASFNPSDDDLKLFDHDLTKTTYLVDHYPYELNLLPAREIVHLSAYWYSVWSHRRNHVWKGFLQVELTPTEDLAARPELTLMQARQTP